VLLFGLLLVIATHSAGQTHNLNPDSARIVTSDIANFWLAYTNLGRSSTHDDSVQTFTEKYFRPRSPGLAAFTRLRITNVDSLVAAVGRYSRYYAAVRANTLRLQQMAPAIRASFRRMKALYAGATFPDVYFLVGRVTTTGTLSGNRLYIGAEMVARDASTPLEQLPDWARAAVDSIQSVPCIVAHELVHAAQHNAESRTLLAAALAEGTADFLGEQAAGCRATGAFVYACGEAHERELWPEFQQAMHGSDTSRWLHNGLTSTDRPANLGYWMGYRIAKAYYERARDKQRAVSDLLHISDYDGVLVASDYTNPVKR
jgi:hypothetical protein